MPALHESELREYMQSYRTPDLDRALTNIFEFKIDRKPSSDEECNVLCLIEEAAETISESTRYAAERLALADSLAKRAVEQLTAAEQRVTKAEAARIEAEAAFNELCRRTEEEYTTKFAELESLKNDAFARVARAENRIQEVEVRAMRAEARVQAVELTFKKIGDAVKNKLLAQARHSSGEISGKPTLSTA